MEKDKDNTPVIYKQDIMDEDGKLNVAGILLLLACFMGAINMVSKYLNDNIIDKNNVN